MYQNKIRIYAYVHSSVAQSCPTVCNPMTAACQASLSITNSQSLPKLMSIESVIPSSHLILCCPLLHLPPIPPSIRVFSNESTLRMCALNNRSSKYVMQQSTELQKQIDQSTVIGGDTSALLPEMDRYRRKSVRTYLNSTAILINWI